MKPSAATVASTASNAFGIELYRALAAAGPDRNLFVSPYSISVAMTMAAEGASGETEAELARVLRFPSGTGSGPRAIVSVHDG
ncbi:MAG TPA: serpin family protein, partial [Phycisphaerales bacterium]|nr:serpin family protein [Phycisphaerales bacterium]